MSESLQQPYLRVHSASLFSRDLDKSLDFYVNVLGFKLVFDHRITTGNRYAAVVPSRGSTVLVLSTASREEPEHVLIAKSSRVALVTENVEAVYQQ